ncbi:STN domain-containing protein [Athalassotoga saccharophila]|uniref:STN domain-containing protein n=1 Tax=Athalassotoga saccharophila TaxID=1441386 RepID=UPI00137AA3B9|nr:STN domain-containing protein [Athalassotoga saccharophila]BBJ28969.1 type II and III secretion system protein [Athalassotoga saccharophila]
MKKIILISLALLISVAVLAYASGMTSSFVFSQESLQSAFQDVSMAFNVSIVVDPTVSGNITMNLNNVTLDQALSTICKGYGLFYFNYDGVYFVGTNMSAMSMKAAGYSERVIELKYLSSSNVMAFLQPYSNYITYAQSYPYLFFFGPNSVYEKVLSTVKSVDVPGTNVYVVYNIYTMSNSNYAMWQNDFYSSYIMPGQFKSTNFEFFQKYSNYMKFEGNGFALAGAGKNIQFKANYLPSSSLSMNVLVNSIGATQANLNFNLSVQNVSSGTVQGTPSYTINTNSTVTVGDNKMAVASFRSGNSNFIVTVSTVRSAPSTSIFTLMDMGPKVRTYNLVMDYNGNNNTIKALGNIDHFGLKISAGQNIPSGIYVGISSPVAIGLQGYLLIGGPIFSNLSNVNNYKGEIALVQYPDFKSNFLSSGVLTVSASLTSLANFHLQYNGNLEYKMDNLVLGGEFSYNHIQLTGSNNFDLYGSIGLVYYGEILRVLYSPISNTFKFEMNWGG